MMFFRPSFPGASKDKFHRRLEAHGFINVA